MHFASTGGWGVGWGGNALPRVFSRVGSNLILALKVMSLLPSTCNQLWHAQIKPAWTGGLLAKEFLGNVGTAVQRAIKEILKSTLSPLDCG